MSWIVKLGKKGKKIVKKIDVYKRQEDESFDADAALEELKAFQPTEDTATVDVEDEETLAINEIYPHYDRRGRSHRGAVRRGGGAALRVRLQCGDHVSCGGRIHSSGWHAGAVFL